MVWCVLFLLSISIPAFGETGALLVKFGVDGKAGVDWSGEIILAGARLKPWQMDAADSVGKLNWKCVTRQETYWDTPYERSMKPTSQKVKTTPKGILIEFDASNTGSFEVFTRQGTFTVTPGFSQRGAMDGRVDVVATTPMEMITQGPDAEDYPSVLQANDGTLWAAWIAYEKGSDRVYVRRRIDGEWTSPEPITEPGGDCHRTALAMDKFNRMWVIWAGQEDGNFDLYAKAYDGKHWSAILRLTSAPGPDIYPTAVTDKTGIMHVAWMSARNGNFDIYMKSYDGQNWTADQQISTSPANDWEPALAAAPDGSLAILWDTYDKGNYDIAMRTLRYGKFSPVTEIANSPAFEARVTAQYDDRGGLWMAWEEGDANWGKDYGQGIQDNGRGLVTSRRVRVARLHNGRVAEPTEQVSESLPEEFRQVAAQPRLMIDRNGHPWIFFRYRVNLPVEKGEKANRGMWRQAATYLRLGHWVHAYEFVGGYGRIDAPIAVAPIRGGRFFALWTSEDRRWPDGVPGMQELASATFSSAAPSPAVNLYEPLPWPSDGGQVAHPREADDLRRIREFRVPVAGKQYRIVRGDMHRHTDISWDGNRDGSLDDAYRYALDAAGFEFLGVCDHQAGNTIPYNWWRIQKAVDLYSIPGRFAPLYSYERSLPYPNGHRNVLLSRRGTPVLPISAAEQNGTAGAAKLYQYLSAYGGLTTSHTSATGAGTDWRDSSEEFEPVVEIYQGYRHNYEGPGTPRSPKPGEEPERFAPGYVWNAWAKGIKMGVQSSSDHVSTHVSYAAFYVDSIDRDSIMNAIRARRTYAATDNIVVDFRVGEHFMGEAFRADTAQTINAFVGGTGPVDRLVLVKNNRVIYTAQGTGNEMRFTYTDRDIASGEAWYYLRVEQKDGQLAWSSPVWVRYP